MTPPLRGLVLAGGRSTRMGRDKATLSYHGRTQLEVGLDLLRGLGIAGWVSVRPDQTADPARVSHPQIVDGPQGVGPIAGILAALRAEPGAAWLVLACDLPYLDAATVRTLIAARDPTRVATAFRSGRDGLPEPLCAIWEPQSGALLARHVADGGRCPRKFLIAHDTHLIDLPRSDALDNINSAPEYWQAMQDLHPKTAATRPLTVQYFALLREQAGRATESLESAARTPQELYTELQQRHRFTLPVEMLRVAVNGEFGEWGQPLAADDTVVFIPPVAGG
jgi:molybdopterin-guanine dinucleotide biosynthesis protein A